MLKLILNKIIQTLMVQYCFSVQFAVQFRVSPQDKTSGGFAKFFAKLQLIINRQFKFLL